MGKKIKLCFNIFQRIIQYSRGTYYMQEVN